MKCPICQASCQIVPTENQSQIEPIMAIDNDAGDVYSFILMFQCSQDPKHSFFVPENLVGI